MPSDAQLVIQITANIAGFKAGLAEAKAAVRSFDSQVKSTSAASQVAAANTKGLAASTRAVSAATKSASGWVAEMAQQLKAEGLSADEAASALVNLGASQREANAALNVGLGSQKQLERAAKTATAAMTVQKVSSTESATTIAAALAGMGIATEDTGEEVAKTAKRVDYLTGSLAYGTTRVAAYSAKAGPLGYVLGSVARSSETLAPILSALFPIAMIGMAVQLLGQFADKLLQASEKAIQMREQMNELTASTYDAVTGLKIENMKLEDQIAVLEHGPKPNALAEALAEATAQANKLNDSLTKTLEKEASLLGNRTVWSIVTMKTGPQAREMLEKHLLVVEQIKLQMHKLAEEGKTNTGDYYNQQVELYKEYGTISAIAQAWSRVNGVSDQTRLKLIDIAVSAQEASEALVQEGEKANLTAKVAKLTPGGKESTAEANRRWLLSHTSATSVHAKLSVSVKAQTATVRSAAEAIREYDRVLLGTAGDEKVLTNAIRNRIAAMGAAGTAALATIVPATSPTAPTSGVSFGVGTVSDQLAAAEAVQEHLRALQQARVISYGEMIRQLEALDAELYSQRLISEQEYNRRIQTLEDQQLVHNVRLKTAGEETGASLSKAIMDGMTKREPNAMSIELYNWFARSWDSAIEKLTTGGLTNVFQILLRRMGSESAMKSPFMGSGLPFPVPTGGILGKILGFFTPHAMTHTMGGAGGLLAGLPATPPFLPALTAQSKLAGTQSAMEFHNSFSSTLAGLPLKKGVATMFSGITSEVASASSAALASQKATDEKSRLSSAKTAAANTWKAVSHIPIIGPFIAPAAAAAAYAGVLAFKQGGIVPETSMALVHKNEMILPSSLAEHIKNSMRTPGQSGTGFPGGAGAVHLHYTASVQALDTEGIGDILSKHGEEVAAVLERYLRSKNRA